MFVSQQAASRVGLVLSVGCWQPLFSFAVHRRNAQAEFSSRDWCLGTNSSSLYRPWSRNTAVISYCGAGTGWMYLASCSLWLPCCFPWHCHRLEKPGVCRSVWQLLHNKAGPTDTSGLCGVQWVSKGKYKHRVGVTVMLAHGPLPALGLVWLRNLRDQRRCVPGWKALIDFSLVNLFDSILSPYKLKPSTRCQWSPKTGQAIVLQTPTRSFLSPSYPWLM